MSLEPLGTYLPVWHLYCHQRVEVGKPNVPLLDEGNIVVREVQVGQVVDLIQKVANPVEPLVGQWVGSGGFAIEILMVSMQIVLGWVAW